ncbi:hypothetical protein ABZ354_05845 [Streptomyces sp. NPDC005925]|uniref:hypothetical protein n=1 Tax=Streptomyces sp. NPDC005925 TaxID=3157172 RepID=UPI0033E2FE5E
MSTSTSTSTSTGVGTGVGIGLRDRFFALSAGREGSEVSGASEAEVARYRAEVDATDTGPAAVIDGLSVSWHPTARFKAVRFLDAERVDETVRDLFARPSADAPHLAAVFVDPRELSFRTFENIVPLDRLFEDGDGGGSRGEDEGARPALTLGEPVRLAEGAYTAPLQAPDTDRARLLALDELNLYVPPLNSGSRGGERFIFHSALLADALTKAVSKALPPEMIDGFSHVNPVFRCNRFEPGDANFHHHRDTPYYDAARGHVSRYTLLLYLTGGSGEGEPVLDLTGGTALTDIDAFTCVVFDQRYEHEGAPYRDGRKVFLRSELIHHLPESETAHDPSIGALFSKACYLTGESVFAPELARYADTYYDRVAAAHWNGLPATATGTSPSAPAAPVAPLTPFVHKRFRGVDFVANGYDFWFARRDGLTLTECAALTLLDYFNCKLGDSAFRDVCESTVVEAAGTDWIPGFLAGRRDGDTGRPGEAVAAFDKSVLFPDPEEPNDACCPFHSWGFDATRFQEIIDLNAAAQTFAKAHIMPAPILMLGQDVVLDPEKFVVRGNQIHVLGKESLTPVNFAACWNSGGYPNNYIDVLATVGTAHFLVPPILFSETDHCYHLRFDFFRNSWTVQHEQSKVPVPRIRGIDEMDFDPDDWETRPEAAVAYPWMSAVDPSLVKAPAGTRGSTPWWTDGSDLDEELIGYMEEIEEEYEEDQGTEQERAHEA